MAIDTAQSYDELPYGDKVFASTHPDNLATIASLVGMRPAPSRRCRVLELGCASGWNLFSLAVALPESQFVGIDLSARQIEQGLQTQSELGLTNVTLRAANILDVDESYGSFDYILCHGVFSWVPPPVQEAILRLCRARLTSQGIAYISYNCYPGWHFRGLMRDFLHFRVRNIEGMQAQVEAARSFMELLERTLPDPEFDYTSIVRKELKLLVQEEDSYLYHEHLETCNQPFYFYQFMDLAAQQGLQYVGEAESHPVIASLSAATLQEIAQLATSQVESEQYLDFYSGRMFRRTLLCHPEVELLRRTNVETFQRIHATTSLDAKTENPCFEDDSPVAFETKTGLTLTTNNPAVKVMMAILIAMRPQMIPFPQLVAAVRERLPGAAAAQADHDPITRAVAETMLRCYQSHTMELRICAPPDLQVINERPIVTPLARWQAQRGIDQVTNLRCRIVTLEGIDKVLVPFLDGRHDRPALVEVLVSLARQNVFEIRHDGKPVSDEKLMREVLDFWVSQSLERIRRCSLLIG